MIQTRKAGFGEMLLCPSSMNLPRVGFVVHVMQVAGAEMLVTQLIERLREKIDPTIFCLDAIGLLGERMQAAGVPVVVLNRSSGIDTALPGRFAKELRQRKIDILHAHQYTPFFYSALAKLRGARKAKIIFTEHGRHYPDHVSWKRKLANRLILSRLSYANTACCDFSARATESNDGFPRVDTIPNGVDLARFPKPGSVIERMALRQRLGLDPELLYVGCIARFHPVKDHGTLLRAWQKIQSFAPNARLVLIGDGPQKADMEALSQSLGVAGTTSFWGIRHDVPDILRAIDLFTLTSVSEASSLTLLEAMASECPPVVTDVGGNSEHMTHGVEGWLAPRGDHEQLAAQLLHALSHPALRAQAAVAARRRVETQFELGQTIARYEKLYLSAATGGKL